jgi:phosphate transport system substrate-binding protein
VSRLARSAIAVAIALAAACGRPDTGAPPRAARCDPPAPRPDGLVLAGSGSNIALVRELAKRYRAAHPDVTLRVPESIGTGGALRALADGAIDVGLASRTLSAAERRSGLVETMLARVPIAVVVHPEATVTGVTRAELAAIYRGDRQRWPDGTPIVPLLREPGDSGNDVIAQSYPDVWAAMSDAMQAGRFTTCYTDQEMADTVDATEGAVGFLDLGTLRLTHPQIRALALDGVVPTPANALAGRYRLVKPLTFVTAGPLSTDAVGFIAFATSGATADLLATAGYVPSPPDR